MGAPVLGWVANGLIGRPARLLWAAPLWPGWRASDWDGHDGAGQSAAGAALHRAGSLGPGRVLLSSRLSNKILRLLRAAELVHLLSLLWFYPSIIAIHPLSHHTTHRTALHILAPSPTDNTLSALAIACT
ncbi:hypothetical protein SCAR479_04385 [Seiridium cardinale]|uniref:Uncharacterized protein n=1 Tax=Seiridium cardinale TaxID=138064 RepID=A0ABR2XYE2_9PEZI